MELLAPWSLVALAAVPAVFLWGVLAPRSRPVVVGSLMLWRRALGTGAAGKPSARLRLKDPLVWLDAAAIGLIVLACAQPAVRTAAPAQPVATLVLDRTASMGATDGPGAAPRWRGAQAMLAEVLKAAEDGPVRVVSVPDASGAVLAAETTAADLARRGAAAMEPVPAADDAWAVALAEAAARPDLPVVVATDTSPAAARPPNVFALATGGSAAGAGLTRAATRLGDGQWWLLVSGRADADAPGAYGLEVSSGGTVLAARPAFLEPGREAEVVLPFDGPAPAELRVDLKGPPDAFPLDDTAYLALEPAGDLRVLLIGEPDAALRRGLAARADIVVTEAAAPAPEVLAEADLVIACRAAVPEAWRGPAAVVAPPEAVGPVQPEQGEARAEWRVAAGHPLADAFYLDPPQVAAVRRHRLGPGAAMVLGTPEVPLMATWEADGQRRLAVLFGFGDEATDWPRRAGFPVFWSRAIDWLLPRGSRPAAHRTYRPFEPMPGLGGPAPAAPGLHGEPGRRYAVSFIGTDEGFQTGAGRDDSQAAVAATRASAEARRRSSRAPVWPYVAGLAVLVLVARAWAAR